MIDTRAPVRRAAPPSIWAATWSRRWPSGAVLNRVADAQLRADPTADRRPLADERKLPYWLPSWVRDRLSVDVYEVDDEAEVHLRI